MIDSQRVADGVTVRQYASVVRDAEVGEGTVIGPCALVDAARVGRDCRIGHGAAIHPGVWIGDRVFIGPGVIFCNDYWPEVGKTGFSLDSIGVVIRVEDDANIGAGAIILPGVVIGKGAMVAAGAVVTRSVPANRMATRCNQIMSLPADRRSRRMRQC